MAKTRAPARHAPPAFVAALRGSLGGEAPAAAGTEGRLEHGGDLWLWRAKSAGWLRQASAAAAARHGISFAEFAYRLYHAGDGDVLRYTAHRADRSTETVYLVELAVERLRPDYTGHTWALVSGGAS